MPDYQYPGRLEMTNINDAFGKKDRVQQAILDRHNAKDTLKKAAESSLVKIEKPVSPPVASPAAVVEAVPPSPLPVASSAAPEEAS